MAIVQASLYQNLKMFCLTDTELRLKMHFTERSRSFIKVIIKLIEFRLAWRILVPNNHKKFNVDAVDSFSAME